MDKYSSVLGKLAGRIFHGGRPYAITLGQTTYYSCPIELVTPRWRRHKDNHKARWEREGKLKFACTYVWQWLTRGYANIDAEIEARAAETEDT